MLLTSRDVCTIMYVYVAQTKELGWSYSSFIEASS